MYDVELVSQPHLPPSLSSPPAGMDLQDYPEMHFWKMWIEPFKETKLGAVLTLFGP